MADRATKKFIGAVPDEWQLYSDNSKDYTLGQPIGFGASSIVYQAVYHPRPTVSQPVSTPIPCALKVLDLDSLPPDSLRLLQQETTLMSLSKHPNVLRVRGSWMDGHKLYIAMRLMNKGSAADVMRYGWPGGMEEEVVRCILKQALEGLNYLHVNGFIHRDVKAANLLIDDDGTVLLGDLGVAASLDETTSPGNSSRPNTFVPPIRPKMGKRKSFVGTPCWMSPELIQGHHYDSSSDIWSFGITALELTQGRPPRSRDHPGKVLVRIVQDRPPQLDREGGVHKYSRAFKEIVDRCLVKDPTKRPTAEELLQMPFFKGAKRKSYLVGAILHDLPPLTSRQERRRTSSHRGIDNTVESWDFSLSPTSSMIRHSRQASLVSTGLGVASPTTSIFREGDELEIAEEVAAVGDSDEEVSGGALDQVEEIQAEADTTEDPGPSSPELEVASTPATSACDTDDPTAVAPSDPIAVPVPAQPDSQTLTRSSTRTSAITNSSPASGSRPISASASITSPPTISLWRKLKRMTSAGNMKDRTEQQEDSSEKGRKRKSVMGNFFARGAGLIQPK